MSLRLFQDLLEQDHDDQDGQKSFGTFPKPDVMRSIAVRYSACWQIQALAMFCRTGDCESPGVTPTVNQVLDSISVGSKSSPLFPPLLFAKMA